MLPRCFYFEIASDSCFPKALVFLFMNSVENVMTLGILSHAIVLAHKMGNVPATSNVPANSYCNFRDNYFSSHFVSIVCMKRKDNSN